MPTWLGAVDASQLERSLNPRAPFLRTPQIDGTHEQFWTQLNENDKETSSLK
jgi:hypothetical protein